MRIPSLRVVPCVAALLLALVACSESVAPDVRPSDEASVRPTLLGGVLVSVLQRNQALASNLSTSATIGSGGGTLSIPSAGFTLTVPAGAVSAPVTMTATALAGSNVAYRLEPHGLVFAKQPVITQDLSLTQALLRLLAPQLAGGYVADESTLGDGVAVVTETRPASVNLLAMRMSFSIAHFSGYIASSGRQGGYFSSSGYRHTGRGNGI
jgi:hypothetical protein